jgi:signal peptidase I
MVRFTLWAVGMVGIVLLLLYRFALDVWTVPADDPLLAASIAPTLDPGDVVVLTRHPAVAHGNLMRCPDPQAPGRFVVARAIAQGGETVSFASEVPLVDGQHTPSPRACEPQSVVVRAPGSDQDVQLACSVEEFGEMDFSVLSSGNFPRASTTTPRMVDPGTWFLVSDNRHFPLDSRDYGAIDPARCQHVVARIKGREGIGASILW